MGPESGSHRKEWAPRTGCPPHHTPGVEKELGVTAAGFPELGGLGHRFSRVRPVSMAASGSSSRGNRTAIGEACVRVLHTFQRLVVPLTAPLAYLRQIERMLWKRKENWRQPVPLWGEGIVWDGQALRSSGLCLFEIRGGAVSILRGPSWCGSLAPCEKVGWQWGGGLEHCGWLWTSPCTRNSRVSTVVVLSVTGGIQTEISVECYCREDGGNLGPSKEDSL